MHGATRQVAAPGQVANRELWLARAETVEERGGSLERLNVVRRGCRGGPGALHRRHTAEGYTLAWRQSERMSDRRRFMGQMADGTGAGVPITLIVLIALVLARR